MKKISLLFISILLLLSLNACGKKAVDPPEKQLDDLIRFLISPFIAQFAVIPVDHPALRVFIQKSRNKCLFLLLRSDLPVRKELDPIQMERRNPIPLCQFPAQRGLPGAAVPHDFDLHRFPPGCPFSRSELPPLRSRK